MRNLINTASGTQSKRAFSLPETMIAMTTFWMVIGGFISAHLFGLKYDQRVCSKLGASEQARVSFERLTSDIRASKIWRIGNGDITGFTNLPNATLQQGNALQLCLTTDTNSWVRYYFETNGPTTGNPNGRLCRITSDGIPYVIAQYLTNVTASSMAFHAEDYRGTNVYDYNYKYVIVTLMEFSQYQFPKTMVGPGYYYDYYRIQLKSTSHCPS